VRAAALKKFNFFCISTVYQQKYRNTDDENFQRFLFYDKALDAFCFCKYYLFSAYVFFRK